MKKIWILVILGGLFGQLNAQVYIASCVERLKEARELAGRGLYERIEKLLQPCIGTKEFTEQEETEAIKLIELSLKTTSLGNKSGFGNVKEDEIAAPESGLPVTNRPFLQLENVFDRTVGSTKNLQDARVLFDKGKLDEVPPLLHKILKSPGINKVKKVEVQTLLTETYLFLRHTDSASLAYLQLWRTDPTIRPSFQIHTPDFVFFAKKFKSFPSFWAGVKGGINMGFIDVKKAFDLSGVNPIYTTYSNFRTNQFGAGVSWFPSSPKFGLGLDVLLTSGIDFQYNSEFSIDLPDVEANFGTLLFYEEENILQMPVYAKWNWGKYDYYEVTGDENGTSDHRFWRNLTPYCLLGLSFQYMTAANFTDIQRNWRKDDIALPFTGSADLKLLNLFGLDGVQPLRKRYNLGAMAGIGMNYRLSYKFALFAEATYSQNLFSWVHSDNRYADKTVGGYTFLQQFYLDDDLTFHQIALQIGFEIPIWYKIVY